MTTRTLIITVALLALAWTLEARLHLIQGNAAAARRAAGRARLRQSAISPSVTTRADSDAVSAPGAKAAS